MPSQTPRHFSAHFLTLAALLGLSACSDGSGGCDPLSPFCTTGTLPSLTIADASVVEGSGGTVEALFDVTLSAAPTATVVVSYAAAAGTALPPQDMEPRSGRLIFPAGTTTMQAAIPVHSDVYAEGPETFTVTLAMPTNATISDGTAVGTIVDDDTCPLAGSIAVGQTVTGDLDSADCALGTGAYYEMWLLVLSQGAELRIDHASQDFDSYLHVWQTDGTPVTDGDDGGLGANSRITVLLAAGAYLVSMTSEAAAEVGDYELSINRTFFAASAADTVASSLYTIDPSTGTEALVGPIGFDHVSAMDFHPISGTLYGIGERAVAGDSTKVLITIDQTTGAGTEVGPLGITSRSRITDMSFRGDGRLFAHHAESAAHAIYTVDTTSGVATLVGPTGLSFSGGNGIVFSAAGTLYHSNAAQTSVINQTTGGATLLAGWAPPPGCSGGRIGGADLLSGGTSIYGILKCGFGSVASTEFLVVIDYPTASVIQIGPTGQHMDALAIR